MLIVATASRADSWKNWHTSDMVRSTQTSSTLSLYIIHIFISLLLSFLFPQSDTKQCGLCHVSLQCKSLWKVRTGHGVGMTTEMCIMLQLRVSVSPHNKSLLRCAQTQWSRETRIISELIPLLLKCLGKCG